VNPLFTITALWGVVGFAGYYFLSVNHSFSKRIWKRSPNLDFRIKVVVLQRAWGVLFLGLASLGIVVFVFQGSPREFGLGVSFEALPPWWSLLVFPLILLAGYFSARSPSNLDHYPQIRIEYWTLGTLLVSAVSWIVFLVAYEFFFRGFILFSTLSVLEPWPAIALNCALYAFAHFYKGPGETFGAIPVGVLLCYLTLRTGNIWSAVTIHSVMALSNEWFSLRAHPQMQLLRK
jgi:membrane protease YdiL (CAAX protease family)